MFMFKSQFFVLFLKVLLTVREILSKILITDSTGKPPPVINRKHLRPEGGGGVNILFLFIVFTYEIELPKTNKYKKPDQNPTVHS